MKIEQKIKTNITKDSKNSAIYSIVLNLFFVKVKNIRKRGQLI